MRSRKGTSPMYPIQRPRRHSSGNSRSNRQQSNERIVLYGLIAAGGAAYALWTAVVPDTMVWWGRLLIIAFVVGAILTMVNWAITTDMFIQLTREYRRMKESNDRKIVALAQVSGATQRRLSDNHTRLGLAQLSLQRGRLFLERQVAWATLKLDQKLHMQQVKQLPQKEEELDPYIDVEFE